MLFTLIVFLGLGFRFYLERLRLLLVPRLAAVVTIVVMLMTAISILSERLGMETGLSVSLFPMVIISMVIERMSIVWEERGAATSMREGAGSLLMAALAYLFISLDVLVYWVTVFPEINLLVLGIIVVLGRYTGEKTTVDRNPLDKIDDYAALHLTAAYRLPWGLDVQLAVNNLLDTEYFDPALRNPSGFPIAAQVPQPGRIFFLQLRARR